MDRNTNHWEGFRLNVSILDLYEVYLLEGEFSPIFFKDYEKILTLFLH